MLKKVSYFTHQGPYLHVNEDLVDSDIDLNLYSVFDGFGGSNIGDTAASLARDSLKKGFTKISADEDSTMPFTYSARYILETNALMNAFHQGHQALTKINQDKRLDHRGGASVCALALSAKLVSIVNCGNTQAFLVRENKLHTLIAPDNFVHLSAVKDSQKTLTTIPTMGLGLFEELQLQVIEFLPQKDDIIILATDGLNSMLSETEIIDCLNNYANADLECLSRLAELNNEQGNWDNQSGIILRF